MWINHCQIFIFLHFPYPENSHIWATVSLQSKGLNSQKTLSESTNLQLRRRTGHSLWCDCLVSVAYCKMTLSNGAPSGYSMLQPAISWRMLQDVQL